MTTNTNQDEDEGADLERKARNLDAKKRKGGSQLKTKGLEKSRVSNPPATSATNNDRIG